VEPSGRILLCALYRYLRAGKEAQPQTLKFRRCPGRDAVSWSAIWNAL